MKLIIIIISTLMISLVLFFINMFLQNKLLNTKFYKMMPFECGAFPFMMNNPTLSLKYYKIILLFLLFDVEFALILPTTYLNMKMMSPLTLLTLFTIYNFLIMSLYYELGWGILKWTD